MPPNSPSDKPDSEPSERNGTAASGVPSTSSHLPPGPTTADAIRAEIDAVAQRFLAANAAVRRAQVLGDDAGRVDAEAARSAALGAFCLAGRDVADLAIVLLRYAFEFDRETLRLILVETLLPELQPIADAVGRLELRQ